MIHEDAYSTRNLCQFDHFKFLLINFSNELQVLFLSE